MRLLPLLLASALATSGCLPTAAPTQAEAQSQSPRAGQLVNEWVYDSVKFFNTDGSPKAGSGGSGTLTFKADGTFEQHLRIGEFNNDIEGTYQVTGPGQMTWRFSWGGRDETPSYTFAFEGDRLKLETDTTGGKARYELIPKASR